MTDKIPVPPKDFMKVAALRKGETLMESNIYRSIDKASDSGDHAMEVISVHPADGKKRVVFTREKLKWYLNFANTIETGELDVEGVLDEIFSEKVKG